MSLTEHRRLLIVWHSRTDAARQLAEQARQGARQTLMELNEAGRIHVQLMECTQVREADLLQADAYLFCAPENLGSLSGAMKEFFDRLYYAALDRLNGRPYAALISAGSDGHGALTQLERICTGWRLEAARPAQIFNFQAQTPEAILRPKTLDAEQARQAQEAGAHLAALLCL